MTTFIIFALQASTTAELGVERKKNLFYTQTALEVSKELFTHKSGGGRDSIEGWVVFSVSCRTVYISRLKPQQWVKPWIRGVHCRNPALQHSIHPYSAHIWLTLQIMFTSSPALFPIQAAFCHTKSVSPVIVQSDCAQTSKICSDSGPRLYTW